MSGLSEKVDASDIFPSISIYSGSEQIEYLRGSSAVINMDKYSDRSNINIIIQAKQDNSIIPSVIANSKAKVVKPEELIPIQSSLKKIEGSETDVVDALVWNKKRWETGTNHLMAENCNIMLLKKYGTQELTFQNMIVLFAMDY
jgi:hypothetical protein